MNCGDWCYRVCLGQGGLSPIGAFNLCPAFGPCNPKSITPENCRKHCAPYQGIVASDESFTGVGQCVDKARGKP